MKKAVTVATMDEASNEDGTTAGMPPAPVDVSGEPPAGLSATEWAVLVFEQQWWKYAGAKETAVRETFDMSMTRYYQLLNALIDRSAALAADPLTVGRLRRLRAARQRQRSAASRPDRSTG